MARRKQSRGKCAFCGRDMAKGSMARHLSTCLKRQEAINTANRQPGKAQVLHHLRVQDAWEGDFWLHLEMKWFSDLGGFGSLLACYLVGMLWAYE